MAKYSIFLRSAYMNNVSSMLFGLKKKKKTAISVSWFKNISNKQRLQIKARELGSIWDDFRDGIIKICILSGFYSKKRINESLNCHINQIHKTKSWRK